MLGLRPFARAYTRARDGDMRKSRQFPSDGSPPARERPMSRLRTRRRRRAAREIGERGTGVKSLRPGRAPTACTGTYTKNLWRAVGLIFKCEFNLIQTSSASMVSTLPPAGQGGQIFGRLGPLTAWPRSHGFFSSRRNFQGPALARRDDKRRWRRHFCRRSAPRRVIFAYLFSGHPRSLR